jgi:hypothetical protein
MKRLSNAPSISAALLLACLFMLPHSGGGTYGTAPLNVRVPDPPADGSPSPMPPGWRLAW